MTIDIQKNLIMFSCLYYWYQKSRF